MGTNGANFAWTPSVSMLSIERVAGDEVGCSKPQRESTDADGDLGETILGRLCLDLDLMFVLHHHLRVELEARHIVL